MTLIKKCEDLFEQRREKRKKYIMNKRKFREESSFDKTLKNEKGKYSNEGKKVL